MEKASILSHVLLLSLSIMHTSCFVPRLIWPQGDIQHDELNTPSLEKKVLVASRSSEFKDAVVMEIRDAFKEKPVYVKFIGIDNLKEEDASDYSAVVLISTCIAWKLDRHVNGFFNRHGNHNNMIVLTTSGDGDWLPDKKGRNFDAISSASQSVKIKEVANSMIEKIRSLLGDE
jgi:hypothetical protein